MSRKPVSTKHAPKAIGPYSQAMSDGRWVFTSGQIAIDPKTNEFIAGDVATQTERVMENLRAVLYAAELGFENVIKTTIFLTDMGDFAAVNALYAERFAGAPPARSTVQVARLPKDARVEIEMIAVGGAA